MKKKNKNTRKKNSCPDKTFTCDFKGALNVTLQNQIPVAHTCPLPRCIISVNGTTLNQVTSDRNQRVTFEPAHLPHYPRLNLLIKPKFNV